MQLEDSVWANLVLAVWVGPVTRAVEATEVVVVLVLNVYRVLVLREGGREGGRD